MMLQLKVNQGAVELKTAEQSVERWTKEIGGRLREARKRAGLVQEDVAKQLGLSIEGYSSMERGKRLIGLEYLLALPSILGCKISDLLPDSVVTDYDRDRARDPLLDEIVRNWKELPQFVREGLVLTVRAARGEERK